MMTVVGVYYYYIVVSLIIIVLGAAVVARISRADPRACRLIAGITAVLCLVMALAWIVLMNLGSTE